jgi:hypothetical protein
MYNNELEIMDSIFVVWSPNVKPPGELPNFERNKGAKEKIFFFSLGMQKTLTQRGTVQVQ